MPPAEENKTSPPQRAPAVIYLFIFSVEISFNKNHEFLYNLSSVLKEKEVKEGGGGWGAWSPRDGCSEGVTRNRDDQKYPRRVYAQRLKDNTAKCSQQASAEAAFGVSVTPAVAAQLRMPQSTLQYR